MLRPRFTFAFSALALVLACGDDATTTPSNNLAFEGVSWVVPDDTGKLVVSWKPVPEANDYRVYVSRIQGRELKTQPAARTNGTSVVITPEKPGERYFVIVRVADVRGQEDRNTVVKSAVANPDKTPPAFPGPRVVEPAGNAGAKVSWDPATDDFTPPEAIIYQVLAGRTRTSLVPVATTGPGDTSVTLNQLGNPTESFIFVVRARDIANNVSADVPGITAAIGQDATVPVFGGCDVASNIGATEGQVSWIPATDNHSPESELTYLIYASTTPQGHDLSAPPAATVVAGTSATLTNLTPGATYHLLCKVKDAAGNIDQNTVERAITTASDITRPSFAGITTFQFDEEKRNVTLDWNAATDDQTAPGAIVYDVYESLVPGKYDFDKPPRNTSAPGATSILLNDLASRSTLNWVVRARDATNNRDENLVEKSGTTLTSYAIDVQGVFNRSCAVVGCHVTGPQPGGLNLAPAFSYGQLVGITSNLKRPMLRVPTNMDLQASWLYFKITGPDVGLLMPAPQTGNALSVVDKDIITSWILQGALKN